jgi:hypothetical protein
MKMTINKTGVNFKAQMLQLEKKIHNASHKAVQKVGIKLLELSIPIAPIDTGDLRESAYVKYNGKQIAKGNVAGVIASVNIVDSKGLEVEVGYQTPYALRQHEDFMIKRTEGTEWKYLQKPFQENIDIFIDEIETETKQVIR